DLDLLAESLSGLGFFIEAFEQQRPDRDRLIAPLIARRLGEAPAPVVVETESVEDAVAALRAELPTLVAEVQSAPADGTAGEELKVKLAGLRDDAELIGDADLVAQADAALKAMASGGAAGLAAVVDVIADGGVADAPEISAETQRLLATDTSTLDAELLDIYLTEAAEVLDTVVEHHRILTLNPGDRESLSTVRRQFHTLKGSGRMVGLADLGELAWEVEQVHNRLIEEDRTVSPSVLAMIDVAQASFRGWVGELRATSHVAPDPNALLAAIYAVQREWPGGAKLPPPAPVLTRVAKVGTAANATAANEPAAAGTSAAADATPLPPPIASEPAAPVAVEEPFGIALDPASLMDIVVPIEAESGDAQSVDMESIDVESVDAQSVDAQTFDTESTGTGVRTDVVLPSAETPPVVFEIDVSAPSPVEIVELAELGAAPADEAPHVVTDEAAPDEESIDIALPPDDAAHAPLLRLVADNTVAAAEPRELPPPAIAASAAAPDSGDAPGYEEPAEGGDVTIGDVTLSASLWAILCDEAEQRVGTLQHELSLLQFDARQAPSEAMVRASHTLCGIHRTGGFPPIARTSKALEQALIALQQRGAPLPTSAQAVLAGAIDHLAQCVTRVRDRIAFTGDDLARADAVTRELEALRRDVMGAAAVDAETAAAEAADRDERQPEVAAEIPVDAAVDPLPASEMPQDVAAPELVAFVEAPSESAMPELPPDDLATAPDDLAPEPAPAPHDLAPEPVPEPEPIAAATPVAAPEPDLRLPAPLVDPLADIRDDVDTQVLAIFLEEASELYPQAGEQVRGWRRNPRDGVVVQHLRRTLHTFKGSARMAGAMRLGELAHLMESRLMNGDSPVSPTDELFDALDGDLDDVAFVLDALRDGKTNVTLPRFVALPPATAPVASATSDVVATAPEDATESPSPQAEHGDDPAEVESTAKAMLRVRADVVDRLVNESGEVQIARSRVEGELRALKANLLELTASVIRLRSQVREIELQAETQ
ncbi:MAG: Hpt domain-containing protein, partial [Casimicrobiaceae bacterium]